eukprot:gene16304-17944_t
MPDLRGDQFTHIQEPAEHSGRKSEVWRLVIGRSETCITGDRKRIEFSHCVKLKQRRNKGFVKKRQQHWQAKQTARAVDTSTIKNKMTAMLLTYVTVGLVFIAGSSYGQLFGGPVVQLGFDFPDFAGPEGIEDSPFLGLGGIQQRIAEITKGQMKPIPGVKTKVKTKHEGKTNITTIEQKGKGYNSWARLTTFQDSNGNETKGKGQSFSKMISGLFGGDLGREVDIQAKKDECSGQKPCANDKYCDPVQGVCKQRLPLGAACFFKDQCRKENDAICIWGKCSTGRKGQSGTFCKQDKECIGDDYCADDPQFSMFTQFASPNWARVRPAEAQIHSAFSKFLGGMVCVPETLVTTPERVKGKQGEETDEEVEGSGQETEEKEDNNEGGDIVPPEGEHEEPEEEEKAPLSKQDQDRDEEQEKEEGQDDEDEEKPPKEDNNGGEEKTTGQLEKERKKENEKKHLQSNPVSSQQIQIIQRRKHQKIYHYHLQESKKKKMMKKMMKKKRKGRRRR